MTPDQCRKSIRSSYLEMVEKNVSHGAIVRIVEAQMRDAARHNGVPENWRNYAPDELSDEYQ